MKVVPPIPSFAAPPGFAASGSPALQARSSAPQAQSIEKIGAFDPRRAGGRQGRDAAAEPTGTAVASPRDILFFRLQAATLATGTGSAAFLTQQIDAFWLAPTGSLDPVGPAAAYRRPVDIPPAVSLRP